MTSPYHGFRPLRPALYHALDRRLGPVDVVRPGERAVVVPETDPSLGREHRVLSWGETYWVSCFCCDDTRRRLSVSHAWCLYDEWSETRGLSFLVKCFNETNCMAASANRARLAWMVFQEEAFAGEGEGEEDLLLPGREPDPPEVVWPPGDVVTLDSLAEGHPARQYLLRRRFDPAELSRDWGLGYCVRADSGMGPAQGRIVIPVVRGGELAGWQARSVGEPPPGLPKYWSMPCPGWRGGALYGLDSARADWVAVVEGPADVWRLAGYAVGLLGSDGSPWQAEEIARRWGSPGRAVLVLLDPGAEAKAARLCRSLERKGVSRLVQARLPDDRDPADWVRHNLLGWLSDQAARAGIELSCPELDTSDERPRRPAGGDAPAAPDLAGAAPGRPPVLVTRHRPG